MKEIFEKIYIKSEADLPTIHTWYIAHSKVVDDLIWLHPLSSIWADIDWYLRPAEPMKSAEEYASQSLPSDEEIEKWAREDIKAFSPNNSDAYYDVAFHARLRGIEWLKSKLK